MLNNKTILITGGTGSFGKEFIKQTLKKFKPKKLIIFSRDELKQYELKKKFSDNQLKILRFFIGDVRDKERVSQALNKVDVVIHAAALKQVDTAEYNPIETIKTNIGGAENIIIGSLKNKVKKVLALSTDKASSPINLYGATKLASDKLFINANNIAGDARTSFFSVLRYGNVMSSRGSVIPYFQKLSSEKKVFPITDKLMTRFSLTLEESVKFSLSALTKMIGGEIFVPKVSSYKILDLVKAINSSAKIKVIGRRPGEKLHEELISNVDALYTIDLNEFYIISPYQNMTRWKKEDFMKFNKLKNLSFVKKILVTQATTIKSFLSINNLKKKILLNL